MKTLIKKSGVVLLLGAMLTIGSIVYAAATIPAGCETPGDCNALTPALQNVSLEDDIRLTDDDGSNYVGFQSADTVGTDTTWTLPAADGTTGQMLSTDGSGILSWVSAAAAGAMDFVGLSDTDFTGLATGALNYFDGTNWVDLGVGTAGQKLAVNTAGDAPEWVTDSTSSTSLETFYEALNSDFGGTPSGIEDLGISYTIIKDGRYLVTVYGKLQVRGNDIFAYVRATDAANNFYQGTEFRAQLGDQSVASDYRKEFSGSATAILELSAGDVVKLRGNETGASDFLAGTSLTVQQLPSTEVINAADTVVNDQSTSGYMDIGDMRMQWGNDQTAFNGLVSFPAPFRTGTDPAVTMTARQTNFNSVARNVSATGFQNGTTFSVDGNDIPTPGVPFSWMAIGLKP